MSLFSNDTSENFSIHSEFSYTRHRVVSIRELPYIQLITIHASYNFSRDTLDRILPNPASESLGRAWTLFSNNLKDLRFFTFITHIFSRNVKQSIKCECFYLAIEDLFVYIFFIGRHQCLYYFFYQLAKVTNDFYRDVYLRSRIFLRSTLLFLVTQ